MKLTDAFHVPAPPPWTDAEASLDVTVSPRVPGRHPCGNCLAMCCWFVLVEKGALRSRADIESVSAHLDYERFVVWIEPDGAYTVGIITPCGLLERATCGCSVHGTPRQPRLCRDFDAETCFYRARFETGVRETLRLDAARWPDYARRIEWTADGERVELLPEVLLHDLEVVPRRYGPAAQVAFDVQRDAVPQPERLVDLFAFFVNFDGVDVVRSEADWLFRFATRRAVDAPPAEFELCADDDAKLVRVAAADVDRLIDELGPALFDLPVGALRERLAEPTGRA